MFDLKANCVKLFEARHTVCDINIVQRINFVSIRFMATFIEITENECGSEVLFQDLRRDEIRG